jgi:hypothetical protein
MRTQEENFIQENTPLIQIISGGQTGADRAGLESAKKFGIKTGGMAPRGYRTQKGNDLSLRDIFCLQESSSKDYPPRTLHNVLSSDGTALFGKLNSPGTLLTIKYAKANSKPYIENPTSEELKNWIIKNNIKILNIAGNREETNPGITKKVCDVIEGMFKG